MNNGVWVRELILLMLMHQFVCSCCGTHMSTAATPSIAVLDNDALWLCGYCYEQWLQLV